MSSPRVLEVPVPNLVPTLKLKQAKRQDYMEENAELEFSFRRPQSVNTLSSTRCTLT